MLCGTIQCVSSKGIHFLTFYRFGRHAFSFAAVELTINNRSSRRLLTKRFKMYIYVFTCNCNSFNVLLLLVQ